MISVSFNLDHKHFFLVIVHEGFRNFLLIIWLHMDYSVLQKFSVIWAHIKDVKCNLQSVWNLRNHKMSCDLIKLSLLFKELVIPWVLVEFSLCVSIGSCLTDVVALHFSVKWNTIYNIFISYLHIVSRNWKYGFQLHIIENIMALACM